MNRNAICGKLPIKRLYFREFGSKVDDLNVDFDQLDRPALVTQILVGCALYQEGMSPPANLFWESSVGKRIQCLLTIAFSGQMQTSFRLKCAGNGCGKFMELDMDLEEVIDLQQKADATDCVTIETNNIRMKLRRPCGNDQRLWLKQSYRNEREVVKSIIETLACSDRIIRQRKADWITNGMIRAINEAMELADPLVNMIFSVACPHCGRQIKYAFNLEEHALKRLRQSQMDLIWTIHSLSQHYHWTESEILAIPFWRRSQYLALIRRDNRI